MITYLPSHDDGITVTAQKKIITDERKVFIFFLITYQGIIGIATRNFKFLFKHQSTRHLAEWFLLTTGRPEIQCSHWQFLKGYLQPLFKFILGLFKQTNNGQFLLQMGKHEELSI